MDFLKNLLGNIDPVEIAKRALTGLAANEVKPALVEFFNKRMNAASRGKLGDHLIAAGTLLKAGKVADASSELAEVIHEIKF